MGSTASGDDVFAWLNRSRLGDGIKHDDWAGSVVRGNRGPSEDHEDHESTVTKVGAEVGYAMSRSLHVDSPMTQTVRSRHCLDNCLGVTTPPGGAPGGWVPISADDGYPRRSSRSTACGRRKRPRLTRPSPCARTRSVTTHSCIVRHRAQPDPGRGDVSPLGLVPGIPTDRRVVDHVSHPGRRDQRPAASDVHRACRMTRRGVPGQLQPPAARRDDGVQRWRGWERTPSRWRSVPGGAACR